MPERRFVAFSRHADSHGDLAPLRCLLAPVGIEIGNNGFYRRPEMGVAIENLYAVAHFVFPFSKSFHACSLNACWDNLSPVLGVCQKPARAHLTTTTQGRSPVFDAVWRMGFRRASYEKTRISIHLLFLLSVIFLTADLRADWSSDWKQTVAAAKKEGRLNLYVGRYGQAALLDEFKRTIRRSRSSRSTAPAISSPPGSPRRRAPGKPLPTFIAAALTSSYSSLYRGKILDSIKSAFILPEVLDESKWYGGKHVFTDSRGPIHLRLRRDARRPRPVLQFQPRQRERVQILWDLTNPKWKGKITSQRPTETGLSVNLQFYYYQPELGPEFIKRAFSAMDVTFGDRRTITDWLAVGKFAICHGCRQIEKASGQGLPVEDFDTGIGKKGNR